MPTNDISNDTMYNIYAPTVVIININNYSSIIGIYYTGTSHFNNACSSRYIQIHVVDTYKYTRFSLTI